MKNPIKLMWVTLAAALVMAACANAQAQQASPYFTGDGGKGIRLAVLEPAGNGLSNDEQWMLSLVQGTIYTVFNNYSAMTLIDKQNIEKIFAEWEQSMSGNYSDADRVKIGSLTNASHILSGTVIKTPNAFMLELAVTDLQSGERKASYSQPVSAAALENHSAIKKASAMLLGQLGVNLTNAAIAELKQTTNIARIQAEEALARGISAQKQGTEVAALSYFFQAAILDPSLAEAVNRSSVMAVNVSSGNIGEDARNDIAWRKSWIKRLEETEQYINNLNKTVSMPYTLFYSDEIIKGDINYQKETMPITIKTNLYGNRSIRIWAQSVEKALLAVYDGLEATGRKNTWGLNWPRNSVTKLNPFGTQSRTFTIVAELVNSQNKVIGRQEFKVRGYWSYNVNYGRPRVNIGYLNYYGWDKEDGRHDVRFTNVKADDITDNLTIQFASVNGKPVETAAEKGVLQIRALPQSEFDANNRFTFAFGEITKYKGTDKFIEIPNTIWYDSVIVIGEEAFRQKSLTGVTIPNSVTSIRRRAFVYNYLTDITIGENVTLGQEAFGNGFEKYYQNSGSRAGRYVNYSSSNNSDGWFRTMTAEEMREETKRQVAAMRKYEERQAEEERKVKDEKTDSSQRKPKNRSSIGAGGVWVNNVGGGLKWDNGEQIAMPYSGGGAYLYFDFVYIEIFTGYSSGGGKWKSADVSDQNYLPDMKCTYINLGSYIKCPFGTKSVKIFPILGIDYDLSVFYDIDNEVPYYYDFSALWFKLGGGMDIGLGKTVYLRAELLYGWRTANDFEINGFELKYINVPIIITSKPRPASGLTFKTGIGIKF